MILIIKAIHSEKQYGSSRMILMLMLNMFTPAPSSPELRSFMYIRYILMSIQLTS